MHHFSETLEGRALARKEGGWRGGVVRVGRWAPIEDGEQPARLSGNVGGG